MRTLNILGSDTALNHELQALLLSKVSVDKTGISIQILVGDPDPADYVIWVDRGGEFEPLKYDFHITDPDPRPNFEFYTDIIAEQWLDAIPKIIERENYVEPDPVPEPEGHHDHEHEHDV